jgi:N-acetylglutamate synthase-like GNAT family acetyltransferase
MDFRQARPEDYEAIRSFLINSGWQHRVVDSASFKRMMENTSRSILALDASRIVGFARALCDEVSNGYISMVTVAPDKRGKGIGRELVRHIVKDDKHITWVLRAGRESGGFWSRMGFTQSTIAMERCRLE